MDLDRIAVALALTRFMLNLPYSSWITTDYYYYYFIFLLLLLFLIIIIIHANFYIHCTAHQQNQSHRSNHPTPTHLNPHSPNAETLHGRARL